MQTVGKQSLFIEKRQVVDSDTGKHFGVWLILVIFAKKTAVFGCLTNALAPPLIALESCSTAQTDQTV